MKEVLFTAFLTAPYDSGMLFVGVFETEQEAKDALAKSNGMCYNIPNIVPTIVGEVVNEHR